MRPTRKGGSTRPVAGANARSDAAMISTKDKKGKQRLHILKTKQILAESDLVSRICPVVKTDEPDFLY